MKRGPQRKDMTGQVWGEWTVLSFARLGKHNEAMWNCRCSCGRMYEVRGFDLRRGGSAQCRVCQRKAAAHRSREIAIASAIGPYRQQFNQVVRDIQRRGMFCDVTYEQFLFLTEQKRCHYCFSDKIRWYKERPAGCLDRLVSNLDRMDNAKGYSLDNVVVCCAACNRGKGGQFTYKQWWTMMSPYRVARKRSLKTLLHDESQVVMAFD
jgi:hypothetical protein